LITAFTVSALPFARRSLYLKIRDRQSYEFALASAAVALDMNDGTVREARIALGGVATRPWRAREAEAALRGKTLDENSARAAAEAAFAAAVAHGAGVSGRGAGYCAGGLCRCFSGTLAVRRSRDRQHGSSVRGTALERNHRTGSRPCGRVFQWPGTALCRPELVFCRNPALLSGSPGTIRPRHATL